MDFSVCFPTTRINHQGNAESSEVETSGIWCITEDLTTLMKFPGYESIFCAPAIHVSFTLPSK